MMLSGFHKRFNDVSANLTASLEELSREGLRRTACMVLTYPNNGNSSDLILEAFRLIAHVLSHLVLDFLDRCEGRG